MYRARSSSGLMRAIASRRLEQEIRADGERVRDHERALLKNVIRTIPDLIWLKDPDGVYLTCNPRFERLYGATEAQIRGRTDFDFVPRETAEFFRAMDQRAIEQGGPSLNEEELTYADGHRELVQTIKTPVFDRSGTPIGTCAAGRSGRSAAARPST